MAVKVSPVILTSLKCCSKARSGDFRFWIRRALLPWCAILAHTPLIVILCLGPMPGVKGFWMMAGMSLNGYGGAGGMGKLMAEWIIDGEAPMDVYGYRATRFGNYYSDFKYAAERTVESVKYYYRLRFPHDEHETARPHRTSPVIIA
jgi:hypothetical protein